MRSVVLAFDIERTGGLASCETIAIGASVVDEDREELDSFLACCYDDRAKGSFEPRCWDEFWSKHPEILKEIEARTPKGRDGTQLRIDAIVDFVEFVAKWEEKAKAEGFHLERCCDNSPFDVHFVNREIEARLQNRLLARLPFPYTMGTDQSYSQMIETHSLYKGFLLAQGPEYADKDWHFWEQIADLYDVGPTPRAHDHLPNNDAFTIGWELQTLKAIARGEIERRKKRERA